VREHGIRPKRIAHALPDDSSVVRLCYRIREKNSHAAGMSERIAQLIWTLVQQTILRPVSFNFIFQ
jgi:hypothetical protein